MSQKKPWIAWAAIAALGLAAVLIFVRFTGGGGSTDSIEYLTQDVAIRCSETGREWSVPRGRMERELLIRGTPLDPAVGLINPETGRPTGFPVDRGEWESTIKRLNGEAGAAESLKRGG